MSIADNKFKSLSGLPKLQKFILVPTLFTLEILHFSKKIVQIDFEKVSRISLKENKHGNKGNETIMKKTILTALFAVVAAVSIASTDVYTFKTSIKYPAVGKTAFVPASTAVNGTLTITTDEESTNATAVLEVTLKKTGEKFTLNLDDETAYAVFGKKGTDVATTLKFVNEDPSEGLTELTFYGWGTLKTKKTGGCTPCGDTTEICSRIKTLKGVVGGKYICPCGGSFVEWDGSCEIGDDTVDEITVYGSSAAFTLKTVDGKKW